MGKTNLNGNKIATGPSFYTNWVAANKNGTPLRTCEYPLLTDARIIGEVMEGFGPYKFINPVPIRDNPGLIRAGIILRLEFHFVGAIPDLTKTNTEFYHGGELTDEIAALMSLSLGIRLKSGGLIREFKPDGDLFGRPVGYDYRPYPILIIGHRGLILPRVVGSHSITGLTPLSSALTISPKNMIALVRAARLYQDALWIAESEPSLSWIMLVSALETAADQWRKKSESPTERLGASKPKLLEILKKICKNETIEMIAILIADSLGATKKFIDFVLEFMPSAPDKRPPRWLQLDWSKPSMRKTLSKIYDYRSKALHGGTPFPAPMCEAPVRFDKAWEAYSERPLGMAASGSGGTWLEKDIPLLLHTFEYIVRQTLLNWWQSLCKI
jgi:hypothetical protein